MTQALALLRRRWYLAAVGLVLTVGLAVLGAYRIDDGRLSTRFRPQYETAAIVNVTAAAPNVADESASTSDRSPRVAHSLKAIVESPSFATRISEEVADWQGGSIRASVPEQTTLVQLLVSAPSPAAAEDAMRTVLDGLPDTASGFTDGAGVTSSPTIDVTGAPTAPVERTSAKGPLAFALVLALGIAATWMLLRAVDAAAATRPARQATKPQAQGQTPAQPNDRRAHRPEPATAGIRT